MWVQRIWPFSVLHRIERKVDHMSSQAEQLKAALDSIAGHVSGLKSGFESMQANLKAATDAAAANNQKSDPMLEAALSEANDLNAKLGAMEDALKPHVDVPQTESPHPAETLPADAPADTAAPTGAPAGDPPAGDPPAETTTT